MPRNVLPLDDDSIQNDYYYTACERFSALRTRVIVRRSLMFRNVTTRKKVKIIVSVFLVYYFSSLTSDGNNLSSCPRFVIDYVICTCLLVNIHRHSVFSTMLTNHAYVFNYRSILYNRARKELERNLHSCCL